MNPFFSIIVPCCDVALYLRECLDSVVKQPFSDWECLLGVEESKDDTEKIAREYAAKDPRFKVFTGPRTGSCSASRNTGIDMATGEYVIFLDGDDTIVEGSLQRLHDKIAARPGADLYPCAIQVRNELTGRKEPRRDNFPNDSQEVLTGPQATILSTKYASNFCQMMQLTIFRREYLVNRGLKCILGLRRQDSEFSPRALYFAKSVVPIHEPYYIYLIRKGSVSTISRSIDYFNKDWAIILKSRFCFFSKLSKTPDFSPYLAETWAQDWVSLIFLKWFSKEFVRGIPRSKRLGTLKTAFSDGFEDFKAVLRFVSPYKRIAAWWMRLFIQHPQLGWMSDLFFLYLYFPLTRIKNHA